jgi:hypothetical protein
MKGVRLVIAGLGLAAMGYALAGAVGNPDITPSRHVVFLVAVLVAHDALLLPLFLAVGALVRHLVPAGPRAIVQAALIVSAALWVVALPLVLGYGRRPDNPSALPRDYPRGLVTVLAVVWLVTAIALLATDLRRRRGARPTPDPRRRHPALPATAPHPAGDQELPAGDRELPADVTPAPSCPTAQPDATSSSRSSMS